MTDIIFRIVGDAGGVDQAFDRVGKAIDRVEQRSKSGVKALQSISNQTALTRQESLALSYTMSDVAASLASGASPFTILLQQGGQVKDSFGGIGPLFSKLAAQVTPGRLAFGGLAGAMAAVGLAAYEGVKQSDAFGRSLQISGNYAQASADSVAIGAKAISDAAGSTVGSARDVLTALIQTGQVGSESLDAIATATLAYSKASGESAVDVTKDFATMSRGVTKWAEEHNRSLHYLTSEQFQYIRGLDAQGKSEEAAKVNAELLTKALNDRKPALSTLGIVYEQLGKLASKALDAMAGIGREDSTEERIASLLNRLEAEREALEFAQGHGRPQAEVAARTAAVQSYETQLETLRLSKRARDIESASQASEAKKILENSDANQAALAAKEKAGFSQRQAYADLARSNELIALQRSYEEQQISVNGYVKARAFIERQAIDAKAAAIDEEIKLEKSRQVSNPAETTQREARIIELETKRVDILRQRFELAEKLRRNELLPGDNGKLPTTPNQDFRQFELAQSSAIQAASAQREEAAVNAARDLIGINHDMGVQLIVDDRARGEAQIAADEDIMRRRLDLGALDSEERKRVEEDFATWRVLRERTLAEELKPEWQRMLEGWQDTNRLMRESSDQFMSGFLDEGKTTFVQWAKTGKLNAASLVDFIETKFLELSYEKYFAQSVSSIGQSIFSFLGGGSGLSSSGGGLGLTTGGLGLVDYGLGGGRAAGGPVEAHTTYLVGERGPELLRMGSHPGTIVPNHLLGSSSGRAALAALSRGDDAVRSIGSPTNAASPTVAVLPQASPSVAALLPPDGGRRAAALAPLFRGDDLAHRIRFAMNDAVARGAGLSQSLFARGGFVHAAAARSAAFARAHAGESTRGVSKLDSLSETGGTSGRAAAAHSATQREALNHHLRDFGGARAGGGPVASNTTYLVGEKGPELLRMGGEPGVVIPNHLLGHTPAGGLHSAPPATGDAISRTMSSTLAHTSSTAVRLLHMSILGADGLPDLDAAKHPALSIAGGRAAGGPVSPYATYWVGESGPELLRMGGIDQGRVSGSDQAHGSGDIHLTLAPVFHGAGVTRNELVNGMATAAKAAVAQVAELRRRGNSRYV